MITLAWILQRICGVIIFFTVSVRLYFLLYAPMGEKLTFEYVRGLFASPLFFYINIAFLAASIYHSLYGIRGIILDFATPERMNKIITWGFFIMGILAFALATLSLYALE